MKTSLTLKPFFTRYLDASRPVMLALSGGPDSLALFHLLLNYRQRHRLDLHICHIDHAWRSESEEEALLLRQMSEAKGLPFHLHSLRSLQVEGNLEDWARQQRLAFYRKLCRETGAQAVLLGHHADDQAETVLKRLLEGAAMGALSGMAETTHWDGLNLWRPLLSIHKTQLLASLDSSGISYFQDRTNSDVRFLRGRMRETIIPFLSQHFGKEVAGSLCRIGREAREWADFADQRAGILLAQAQAGHWGRRWEWSKGAEPSLCELKALLRSLAQEAGHSLNSEQVRIFSRAWHTNQANCSIPLSTSEIYIDRRRLFFLDSSISVPWQVDCTTGLQDSSWRDCWRATVTLRVPSMAGRLVYWGDEALSPAQRRFLDRRWTAAKVPARFRIWVPIWYSDDGVVLDFLRGG